ncbi:family 16 glycosylhydrolase [Patiriisocius sp. Uisw_047]|jgi:hypothetical protein|uniref:glycoside hydrolase family 16 protein n=1 Tax=Patiriisocius sp. Uisw_047 TaxID=3230969 RepID=UPI0039EB0857
MKKITFVILALTMVFIGCEVDDPTFGDVTPPSNLQLNVAVAQDNSGNVTVTPSAEDVINYHVYFLSDAEPVVIAVGETAEFRYTQSGQYQQIIQVIAYGRGGVSSSATVLVDLDVTLSIDPVILNLIAGDGSKSWIWDSSNAGHFGVGDPEVDFPDFFSAAPNQLDPCMYDDVLTFSYDADNNYSFELQDVDATFINWAEVKRFFPDAAPQEFVDECRDLGDLLDFQTSFVIIENQATGALELDVENSTLSYWSGSMEYEIIELTANKLTVRGLQQPFDPTGNLLAWYHTFIPQDGGDNPPPPACDSGATGDTGSGNNDVLVWADEFDVDGPPCTGNWSYNVGTGSNGWGNGETQYYTDRPENIIVEDNMLKITARREDFNGSEFTSSRIVSQDKFEFTFGKVEMRAKLPTGGGTWPALWMLGADFETNPWPAAGEIDIMEHVGNSQDEIFSTLHYPGASGGNGMSSSTIIPGASDNFHIYSVDWTLDLITFSVDGTPFYVFTNSDNLPFDKDFFLIFNVAMGGGFGGAIDPAFMESSLFVDYVRIYQ